MDIKSCEKTVRFQQSSEVCEVGHGSDVFSQCVPRSLRTDVREKARSFANLVQCRSYTMLIQRKRQKLLNNDNVTKIN